MVAFYGDRLFRRLKVMWQLAPSCFPNDSANSGEGVRVAESGAGDTKKVLPLRAREPMAEEVGGYVRS